jgi:hypothetical protein
LPQPQDAARRRTRCADIRRKDASVFVWLLWVFLAQRLSSRPEYGQARTSGCRGCKPIGCRSAEGVRVRREATRAEEENRRSNDVSLARWARLNPLPRPHAVFSLQLDPAANIAATQ